MMRVFILLESISFHAHCPFLLYPLSYVLDLFCTKSITLYLSQDISGPRKSLARDDDK